MARVQVRDLAAPAPIQPAPLQSDTFAAPAPPMIDHNMERLASALGSFGAAIKNYNDDPERKKALRNSQLAEWEKWKGARTNTEQLDAIRQGKAPYWTDPFINEVVRRDYAGLEAQSLSQQLDDELRTGNGPKFGNPHFDPDAYVVGKAAPYFERMGGDPSATVAFGGALERIKEGYRRNHQEALGIAQTARFEDIARSQLDDAFVNAVEDGLGGQEIMNGLRPVYKDVGPRVKGGSLDLKYGRTDDLLLDMLEHRAKDARFADQAVQMLNADRVGVDGETRVGSLASVARHKDRAAGIINTARKALGDAWEENLIKATGAADVARLKLNDGSFVAQIQDEEVVNGRDSSRTVKMTGEARKKRAISTFIDQTRAANPNPEDAFKIEIDTMVKNGIEHPEWIPFLKSTFGGLATTNVSKGPGPDQIDRIQQAGVIYDKIGDRNWNYLKQHLPTDARDFYELNSAMKRYLGANAVEAAQATAYAFSSEIANEDPKVLAGRLDEVRQKAKNMDFSWLPFAGGISNGHDVAKYIETIAGPLMRTGGLDVDTAITVAKDRVRQSAVNLNGRAIMAPGLEQGDVPHVQTILDGAFKANETRLKSMGIDASDELSLAPGRNGVFFVVRHNAGDAATGTGFVTVQTPGKDGKPGPLRPMVITTGDIAFARKANEDAATKKANDELVEQNERERLGPWGAFTKEMGEAWNDLEAKRQENLRKRRDGK